jgi:hypothetical protein
VVKVGARAVAIPFAMAGKLYGNNLQLVFKAVLDATV